MAKAIMHSRYLGKETMGVSHGLSLLLRRILDFVSRNVVNAVSVLGIVHVVCRSVSSFWRV